MPKAAAIIEGHETHTRTAEQVIDLQTVPRMEKELLSALKNVIIRIPITQAVVYGWYDNEHGSYVNILGDRTVSIAEYM
jgi:glyceraldehyde 3-phosphate dehydrogenase